MQGRWVPTLCVPCGNGELEATWRELGSVLVRHNLLIFSGGCVSFIPRL